MESMNFDLGFNWVPIIVASGFVISGIIIGVAVIRAVIVWNKVHKDK